MANNIAKEYIDFSKKNINKYLKMILEKYYDKEIVSSLLETYINVRYYNYYEAKCKSQEANINYYMKLKTIELTNNQTEKFIFKTKTTFYLFKYILYFDNVSKYDDLKEKINEIEKYRQNTLELEKSSFIDDMLKLVKENEKRKQKYLESFKSNHFEIKIEQTNKKKVYNVYLTNTIKFNKIYSNYSINKVYTNGIVNEQKLFITYYQITKQILENAIEGIFEKEYIVAFPCSILEKEQKTNRLINIINDELIKNNLIIKFTYSDYITNKEIITKWIKEGYKVAIIIDEKYNYDERSKMWLDIFKYIIVDKDKQTFFEEEKVIIK